MVQYEFLTRVASVKYDVSALRSGHDARRSWGAGVGVVRRVNIDHHSVNFM